MIPETHHSGSRLVSILAMGLGVVLSAAVGTLAWYGTESVITAVFGICIPLAFVASIVLSDRTSSQTIKQKPLRK